MLLDYLNQFSKNSGENIFRINIRLAVTCCEYPINQIRHTQRVAIVKYFEWILPAENIIFIDGSQ